MRKRDLLMVLVALALALLFIAGNAQQTKYKEEKDQILAPLEPTDLEMGTGVNWHVATSSQGLVYELPEKVSWSDCPAHNFKTYLVPLITAENNSGSAIYIFPQYTWNYECERIYHYGVSTKAPVYTIDIISLKDFKDVENYLEERGDCQLTMTTTPTDFPGTLKVEMKPDDIEKGFCYNFGRRIRFSPTKQKLAFFSLGHDWAPSHVRIADSMHF